MCWASGWRGRSAGGKHSGEQPGLSGGPLDKALHLPLFIWNVVGGVSPRTD